MFRDSKEKAAKETTLIHAMNRLGAVSLFLDIVKGVHARPSVERRGRESTRETRATASPVSRLQSCAWSYDFIGKVSKNRIL